MAERLPSIDDLWDRPPGVWDPVVPPGTGPLPPKPPSRWKTRRVWIKRILWGALGTFVLLFAWLALTAPLSRSLKPMAPPRITLLAADGQPIAQNGAVVDRPVKASELPATVKQAFVAIEDRRFYTHWGVDPRGMLRAAWNNARGGGTQGGSTITQQLAKMTFLSPERNLGRKAREMLIAFWLEGWLTKDQILERYLSNAYFGDNVYGLRAASLRYFNRQPERLSLAQGAMLAGLVQAPSRLAPSRNLAGAQARSRLVLGAMAQAGFITPQRAADTPVAVTNLRPVGALPTGTYFADWAMPQARALTEQVYGDTEVTTTLDARMQKYARAAVAGAALGNAQVALVAMHPNGEVIAMIGGRSYDKSPFNRATQARRQPGSTFKLFVYLAALRSGMTPDTLIDDSPIVEGGYRPKNSSAHYRGQITLRQAFARSSNVAAVRLYQKLGAEAVIQAARDLGIRSPLTADPTLALGSSGVTLLELTSAYAAIAANNWPIAPHGIPHDEPGLFARLMRPSHSFDGATLSMMRDLLRSVIVQGTGRGAALAIDAYGKTGTSQDNRDALFVGYAGDLIVGVWVGNDDNTPLRGVHGGGLPARIWRDFMASALPGARPVITPTVPKADEAPPEPSEFPMGFDNMQVKLGNDSALTLNTQVGGVPVDLKLDQNGLTFDTPKSQAPDKQ
ncbi:MAG: penicillin-binding protein [Sphingomonadales bacterium]|nr:penicillin-binding protein [Sphingomonadales bacterium]